MAVVAVDPFDPRLHIIWHEVAVQKKDKPLQQREQQALALLTGRPQVVQSGPPAQGKQDVSVTPPASESSEGNTGKASKDPTP